MGSGFGSARGSGTVWLGMAPGIVQSWSDGAVVAQVASWSMTGNARVLQNGVMSNAVPFTVDALQITGVNPASGASGTSVTISGSGFGSSQGSGIVWLGSTAGQVTGWSDTAVVATVAATAVSGVARIEQNGVWSNALTFTVPSGDNAVTLSPNLLTMLVGDTHTIQALNPSGQPVTGLTWASSDPTVVSLSTDDPPLLTALAVGHVTITAGTASADVTVSPGDPNYPGTLPLGTVLWSVPGSVTKIVPAVPSPSGVADVFAFQCPDDPSCSWGAVTVQAITSDGTVAWTASLDDANPILPDFLGGLVYIANDTGSITRVDGTTGQITVLYTPQDQASVGDIAVHPDGTIFAVVLNQGTQSASYSVIGIDPTTGAQKFSVQTTAAAAATAISGLMIAGDGYAYLPYSYYFDGPDLVSYVALLRVNSSGASDNINIAELSWIRNRHILDLPPLAEFEMITNADQGILLTWWTGVGPDNGPFFNMALTTGTSVSIVNAPVVTLDDGSSTSVQPVLQAQDGSFIGTAQVGWDPDNPLTNMVSFDQTGAIRWMVPGNYQPQIATADGGLIATDPSGAAITFDQYGNATGVLQGSPTQSWTGNEYISQGAVSSVVLSPMFPDGADFWAQAGGNASGNGTAFPLCPCLLQSTASDPLTPSETGAIPGPPGRRGFQPADSGAPLKTYVILEGDPGLNLGPGHDHNVGDLFHLAAGTEQDRLNALGNLAGPPQRVSSVQDFAAQLRNNGLITGGVVYFGHGAQLKYTDGTWGSMVAPGEQAGFYTNITENNVDQLSNAQLDTGATITLHACLVGFGAGRFSIAQLIANQLQRRVYAPAAGTFFTVDPNSMLSGATAPKVLTDQKPVYLLQDGGEPFRGFLPF